MAHKATPSCRFLGGAWGSVEEVSGFQNCPRLARLPIGPQNLAAQSEILRPLYA